MAGEPVAKFYQRNHSAEVLTVPKRYTYFAIPFDQIPSSPPYRVWYASWSSVRPIRGDRMQVPVPNPPPPPFVVGVTTDDLPQGATLVASGARSDFPPPPPFPSPIITSVADYWESVCRWVATGSGSQVCKYFSIPLAQVPDPAPYPVWFTTWSPVRPQVDEGTLPPFSIGITEGEPPAAGTPFLTVGKDPPPPPPALPAPDTSLASLTAWLNDREA